MGHSAGSGNSEIPGRHDAGGGPAAADIRRTGAEIGGIITLRTAGAELHDGTTFRRAADAVGLGGDEALVVEGDQQQRLQQLAFDGRALHRDDGLVGEDGYPLLNGPDVAVQLKMGQVIEELLVEHSGGAQIVDVFLGKAEVVHRVHELLQAGHDGVTAVIGDVAEKHIKDSDLVLVALVQVARRHGQLVKICHGGQIAFDVQHNYQLPVLDPRALVRDRNINGRAARHLQQPRCGVDTA